MTSRTARIISFSAWVATAVLIALTMIFYYRLSREVEHLRIEKKRLSSEIKAISTDRDKLSSNSIMLKNSLLSYNSYVTKSTRVFNGHCNQDWIVRCRRYLSYGYLLSYHGATLIERITADDMAGYRVLLNRYNNTLPMIDTVNWASKEERLKWIGTINEGIAFSYLKLGVPRQAVAPISLAMKYQGGSPIVTATDLKIKCLLGVGRTEIRRQFDDFRKSLKERIASLDSSSEMDQRRSSEYNLSLFNSDSELRRTCGYADLG